MLTERTKAIAERGAPGSRWGPHVTGRLGPGGGGGGGGGQSPNLMGGPKFYDTGMAVCCWSSIFARFVCVLIVSRLFNCGLGNVAQEP